MSEVLPLLLSLLLGIAAGLALARLRQPRQIMSHHMPADPDHDATEELLARLSERSREVDVLRARLASLERLEKDLSLSDPLTGIPNRMLLTERIDHAITRGQRHNTRLGVMVLDLKEFNTLNNQLGCKACDRLLIAVARRLREVVRAEDTVAHLHGDRFAVALEGVFEREDIKRAQESVLRVFAEPFELDDQPVVLEARIGSALYPIDGTDADALLRTAEHGLSKARKGRKTGRATASSKKTG
ncbi:MAG: GGDEF domain-containing protein [Zoogloeaceae bacterium]|nr:GGDEF domain-containing protein [Zoogloeaceae bacterium]